MPINSEHNRVELGAAVIDRILELATTAATENDADTLDTFCEAVDKARENNDDLNKNTAAYWMAHWRCRQSSCSACSPTTLTRQRR
jgi:hypothetical protein